MPSKSALLIGRRCEIFLGRALSAEELTGCEEIALNYYPNAIERYIDGMTKKKAPQDFNLVYYPIMNGVIRGALRRHDIIYMRGRFKEVYDRVVPFIGDGFSDPELESIIYMAETCSNIEIDGAINVARIRGIHHARYIRAVIDNNRRKAHYDLHKQGKIREYVPPDYLVDPPKRNFPHVRAIRIAWQRKVLKAKSEIDQVEAELNALKRLKGRK